MRRWVIAPGIAFALVAGGGYTWSRMHERGYS